VDPQPLLFLFFSWTQGECFLHTMCFWHDVLPFHRPKAKAPTDVVLKLLSKYETESRFLFISWLWQTFVRVIDRSYSNTDPQSFSKCFSLTDTLKIKDFLENLDFWLYLKIKSLAPMGAIREMIGWENRLTNSHWESLCKRKNSVFHVYTDPVCPSEPSSVTSS
jgi:hypothetical protein